MSRAALCRRVSLLAGSSSIDWTWHLTKPLLSCLLLQYFYGIQITLPEQP